MNTFIRFRLGLPSPWRAVSAIRGVESRGRATRVRRTLGVWCLGIALLSGASFTLSELDSPLNAPDPAPNGRFGWSVAVHGDFALVGEPGASFVRQNEAHIFERVAEHWLFEQSLSPTGAGVDGFGLFGVDIDGAVAVVGAALSDPGREGAAVIFERVDSPSPQWVERTQIDPQSGGGDRRFGHAVSLDAPGGLVLVGAPGVSGGSLEPLVLGSAFVFDRADSRRIDYWNEVVEISPQVPLTVHGFGHAVSLLGDLAVVGSPFENDLRGAIYVFARNQGGADAWGQVARLALSDGEPGDLLGVDLELVASESGLNSHWLAVGAPGRNLSGTVVLFSRHPAGSWSVTQEVSEQPGVPGPFGETLALEGEHLVVGNSNGVSVLFRGGAHTGVASVFRRSGATWHLVHRYRTPGATVEGLGFGVAVDGDTTLLGAPLRDVDMAVDAGALYALTIPLFADGFESGSVNAWSPAAP